MPGPVRSPARGQVAHPLFRVYLGASNAQTHTVSTRTTYDSTPVSGSLGPAQVRHAYGVDQIRFGDTPGDGTGQTIAIVDAYKDSTIQGDLTTFDSEYSLTAPPSFTIVNQKGGGSLPMKDPSGGWAQEISLDVEWSYCAGSERRYLARRGELELRLRSARRRRLRCGARERGVDELEEGSSLGDIVPVRESLHPCEGGLRGGHRRQRRTGGVAHRLAQCHGRRGHDSGAEYGQHLED